MKKIIMTSPTNFSIQYEINPWMNGNIGSTNKSKMVQQWSELRNSLVASGADVIVLPPSPDYCPDAVFTANAGVVYKSLFIPSKFRHEERAVEEPFFIDYFKKKGYDIAPNLIEASREQLSFEGAGDALFNKDRTILWLGTGFRTSLSYKTVLDSFFTDSKVIVRPLELVNPRFYHLDTCFCPLDTGEVLWYPGAFSDYSQMVIESWYEDKNIKVSNVDAEKFACNAVSIGKTVIVPIVTPFLESQLSSKGYTVIQKDMSEFLRSGGACKCLTLEIIQ